MESPDEPLSLQLGRSAKALARLLDDALVAAGGSTPTWQVLLALTTAEHRSQAELAGSVGVRQPTLVHHLDAMERAGWVSRERSAGNRRVQQVVVTPAGEALFRRLRRAAASFDGRLRAGLPDADVAGFRRMLDLLVENAQPD